MRLTHWTDYSLRVLMFCAACAEREQPATVGEIAQAHGISRNHLTKIVMTLSAQGWLETTRGRGGGLRLLKPASEIVLGDVIRHTETDFTLVECFDAEHNTCLLNGHCRLKGVLGEAMDAYLKVLDGVTLADLQAPQPTGGRGAQRVNWFPGLPGSVAD
jgi:Rrf2 family nitric oxide-sensitive transcriptional repressor